MCEINSYQNALRKFFSKNNTIKTYLEKAVSNGNIISLWGAGQKGQAFLSVFDSDCKYIRYVFDKDDKKFGAKLPTGHTVVDYHNFKTDIVLVSGNSFLLETRYVLSLLPWKIKIISLEDVVYGYLKIDEIDTYLNVDFQKKYNAIIAAVVILYHPDEYVLRNIAAYAPYLDQLYLYDNSEWNNELLFKTLSQKVEHRYIYSGGSNDGLGKAINCAAELAVRSGANWLYTFDQDSMPDLKMIHIMKDFVESFPMNRDVSIVAPYILSPTEGIDISAYDVSAPKFMYLPTVIQSGALHNLEVFQVIGGYDERLFIDYVDFDYCIRSCVAGYPIVQLVGAKLYHQCGNVYSTVNIEGNNYFIGKYSPMRYYYQYRNMLYCIKKYENVAPVFVENTKGEAMRIKKRVLYEENYKEFVKMLDNAETDYLRLLS